MARKKILTPEEIEHARRLKEEQNLSNRQIAEIFEVGKTTIWDNVYAPKNRPKRKRKSSPKYTRCEKCGILNNIKVQEANEHIGNLCLGCVVQHLKEKNVTSGQIAEFLDIELKLVNKYWFIVKRGTNTLE